MTTTVDRPRPQAPPPGTGLGRPTRARPSRAAAAAIGIGFIVLLIAAAVAAIETFSGAFSSYDVVTVALPASANAVAVGNPVDYRDIQVGTIADVTSSSTGGAVRVVLHMDPSLLRAIPADIHAAAVPLSIFGTQFIDLQAPAAALAGSAHLRPGQFIPSSSSSGSSSLQTTVANVDDILSALHPADLAGAFDALATALSGQGPSLGRTIASSATYLSQLLPALPQVEADLGLLGQAGNGLGSVVPDLLQATSHLTTTATTITADQAPLQALLTNGQSLATTANGLIAAIATPYTQIAQDLTPLLQDFSQNPNELSQVLAGFTSAAVGFTQAASHGPFLQFAGNLAIQNDTALVLAGLGGPTAGQEFEQAVGPENFNPAPYTAAQCPRYGPWAGNSCAGGAQARMLSQTPAATAGVRQMADAVAGGHARGAAAVGALLLDPLVASMGAAS
jgi:phospholipid/cholesterol/gamma-HCH transport system substrate-binding protein